MLPNSDRKSLICLIKTKGEARFQFVNTGEGLLHTSTVGEGFKVQAGLLYTRTRTHTGYIHTTHTQATHTHTGVGICVDITLGRICEYTLGDCI